MDKNGKEIKTGDTVRIKGGYFKSDNGLFLVAHSPGDPDWLGGDWSLRRLKKNGKLSTRKHSMAFWPIFVTVSDRKKRIEAREHNKKYATIEVIQ